MYVLLYVFLVIHICCGQHLPSIEIKTQPCILERASIACSVIGGLMGAGWDMNLGSLSGNAGEVCKELRKRMIGMCCLQEVRMRGQGAMMLRMEGRDINCGYLEKEMEFVM